VSQVHSAAAAPCSCDHTVASTLLHQLVTDRHINEREDELLLDELPHDASHLVAVEFDDLTFDLDLGHGGFVSS